MTWTCRTLPPAGFQMGLGPSPAPAPAACGLASSQVPKPARNSTITVVAVIQVNWILALPWIAGPSSSSPSRCRQVVSA
jgi:hypothetical protein